MNMKLFKINLSCFLSFLINSGSIFPWREIKPCTSISFQLIFGASAFAFPPFTFSPFLNCSWAFFLDAIVFDFSSVIFLGQKILADFYLQPHLLAFAFHSHFESFFILTKYFFSLTLKWKRKKCTLWSFCICKKKNSPNQLTFSKFTHKHFVKNPSFFHMKKQYFALNLTF